MKNIDLSIKGPFNLIGPKTIFNIPENKLFGIYFFTIKVKNKYLIEYIGITKRNYLTRLKEHMKELMSGGYQLYDFKKIREDKEFLVWKGRYGKDVDDITVFLNNYQKFSQVIKKQLSEFKIFLIPLNENRRILERVEGKIYKILKENNNKLTKIFIKGVKSSSRRQNEKLIKIEIKLNKFLLELPNSFEI